MIAHDHHQVVGEDGEGAVHIYASAPELWSATYGRAAGIRIEDATMNQMRELHAALGHVLAAHDAARLDHRGPGLTPPGTRCAGDEEHPTD